ncbi:ATP-dependent helicase [Borrelia turcica IST7]|uniref:DNA 3'-5' helicase n=1 Tax=Borrelia turcica IST7 TaxID=1104446 RepID=A0A386PLD5_9SPIR|nr:UvrD-helicase domain-containing protein [Borrelia turcica]AYE36464.1 ATP-dependent helicase [Borrelia turcica IST7]
MLKINFLSELNEFQYKAVTTIDGPLLIIAGAGSGKTRVITYRIAYLLMNGIAQKEILALTFTNKAANEMKDRIRGLLGKPLSNLTITTFHAFGLMFLKENYKRLGYRRNFSIYDENDKIGLIKEILIDENLFNKSTSLNSISNSISLFKNELASLSDLKSDDEKILRFYEERLKLYNSFDFDDLILKPKEILGDNTELREKYSNRYKYVLIDEFQDTSLIQYDFIRLLINHNNLCFVGDDDQSIYSWRGANYHNILNFERDYDVSEIKLEQNYRSTKNILSAANFVISNNKNRKDKTLWSSRSNNNKINVVLFEDEVQEAEFIASEIVKLSRLEEFKTRSIGILLRTNSLFRNIEMALRRQGIKYKVSGGTSFFQKKEIKDIISYLNVIINPSSDYDLLRIINVPRRGIGKEYLKKIRSIADKKRCSIYDALCEVVFSFTKVANYEKTLSKQVIESIEDFVSFIEEYRYKFELTQNVYSSVIKEMIENIEYWGFLVSENPNSVKVAEYKYQNIENFLGIIKNWETKQEGEGRNLSNFLNYIVLQTNEENERDKNINVSLMTIHAAKGLEFDNVFFAAVEDNIIPHQRTIEEDEYKLEEERRVFYVALTRTRESLIITMASNRKQDKQILTQVPSRFISEIPEEFLRLSVDDFSKQECCL